MNADIKTAALLKAAQRLVAARNNPAFEFGSSKACDEESFAMDELREAVAVLESAPASSAMAMQAVDAGRWCAVRDYLASTRADLDDDFIESCSSADTLLLCAFADNLILQAQQSPVQKQGRCCYGGWKPKSACASCDAWRELPSPVQAIDAGKV